MLIVTHNTKDFSPAVLNRFGLSKSRPDEFCVDLLVNRQAELLEGVRRHRASLKRAPMNEARYIAHLAEATLGMPKFARALAPWQDTI
jgi:hypothetical protein